MVALVADLPTAARYLLLETVVESHEINRTKAAVANKAFRLPITENI